MGMPVARVGLILVAALLGLVFPAPGAHGQATLDVQGWPYHGGDLALSVGSVGAAGQPVWLGLGLDPLIVPVPTGKGPYHIGTLVSALPLGTLPPGDRLDVFLNLGPAIPGTIGVPVVAQALVAGALSNPATVPLDEPYFQQADAFTVTAPIPSSPSEFGNRIQVADLNSDGFDDLVVGAWNEWLGSTLFAGRAYVGWGPDFVAWTTLESPSPIEQGLFGLGLAVGDVDGDDIDDLVVAEHPGATPVPADARGRLYLYAGGRGFSATPSAIIESTSAGSETLLYGQKITCADFNGDGFADIAANVHLATTQGFAYAGRVEIHWGPSLTTVTSLEDPEPDTFTFFGDRLAGADVTGDGVADLIVGCWREWVDGVQGIGRVYVFSPPSTAPLAILDNPIPGGVNSGFGYQVVGGDLDGDGVAELVATDRRGHAFVFWGPTLSQYQVVRRPPSLWVPPDGSVSYGASAAIGDTNGDGWADVVLGDPFAGSLTGCAGYPEGAVFIALGPYFATQHILQHDQPACGDEFGWSVALGAAPGGTGVMLACGIDLDDPGGVGNAGSVRVFVTGN